MALPIYQEQYREGPLPGPTVHGFNAEAFGSGVGVALRQFGTALQAKIEEFEDAEVMEAMNNFQNEMEDYHLNPETGILNTMQGKNAQGLANMSFGFMGNRQAQIAGKLKSQRARNNFYQMSNQYIYRRHSSNMQYEARNVEQYKTNEAQSYINNQMDLIGRDPTYFQQGMQNINGAIGWLGNRQGWGDQRMQEVGQKYLDQGVINTVGGMMQNGMEVPAYEAYYGTPLIDTSNITQYAPGGTPGAINSMGKMELGGGPAYTAPTPPWAPGYAPEPQSPTSEVPEMLDLEEEEERRMAAEYEALGNPGGIESPKKDDISGIPHTAVAQAGQPDFRQTGRQTNTQAVTSGMTDMGMINSFIPSATKVTSKFGAKRGNGRVHRGVDIGLPAGSEVRVPDIGKRFKVHLGFEGVGKSGFSYDGKSFFETGKKGKGHGRIVVLEPEGGGPVWIFSHLGDGSTELGLKEGMTVGAGDLIAISGGKTGTGGSGNARANNGTLHIELRENAGGGVPNTKKVAMDFRKYMRSELKRGGR